MTHASFLLAITVLLLSACSGGPQTPSLTLSQALSAPSDSAYARATTVRAFAFPADHGPHPAFRTEWWYATGHLAGPGGRQVGYQFTLFRTALRPTTTDTTPTGWATPQLYLGHLAVSDITNRRYHHSQRTNRGAAGLAGAEAQPLKVWLEDWSLTATPGTTWPLTLSARTDWGRLHLVLDSLKPVVLQGHSGLSTKGGGPGNASYYYSHTRLPTRGWLALGADSLPLTGTSWLDREWSTSSLDTNQVGWDWFSVQLDNGTELMLYQLREASGAASPYSEGTWVAADGTTRRLMKNDFTIRVTDHWRSPHSGGRYPAGWQLEVPSLDLRLNLTPALADQELQTFIHYWEGATRVQGTLQGHPIKGNAYVELTGYAQGGVPR